MTGSTLVTKSIPAHTGNYTKNRASVGKISEITIHHAAGNLSVETIGSMWQTVGRRVSSHYGVRGSEVGQYVSESDVAWCNGNWNANCRAVTIETANSGGAPDWPVADDTLQTLIKLVADTAKRNGLHPLVCGKSLTWHSVYIATACPGPYLRERMQYICDEANKINSGGEQTSKTVYAVMKQVIALRDEAAAKMYAAEMQKQEPGAYWFVQEKMV